MINLNYKERRMNLVRAIHAALALALFAGPGLLPAQGLNNLWTMGYNGIVIEEPYGGVDLDFIAGSRAITTVDRWMDFGRTAANISDLAGNLLFSTNGVYVANANGELMLNGDGLNPSWYTSQYTDHPSGIHIPQGCLILPKPEMPDIYYLFHSTIDEPVSFTAHYLYLTTIDMSLAGGLGAVVSKNQVLINDTLNEGRITAVRQANGWDWWVFCFKANSNIYFRLLVTPNVVLVDGEQTIGVARQPDIGQACFSPDGTRYAYYSGFFNDLEIFDFDRCTGFFSNPIHIAIDDYNGAGGVAFSPNSRFLYISSTLDVYQYDTEAPDIAASQVHIAHWDSTYSPSPPFATMFDIAQLAPDGKIYISTGNSGLRLHVINDPDEPGLACNMVQHGVVLPRLNMNSLPNHPNYHLGAVDGSVCDSLGLSALTPGPSPRERGVRASPNPSDGRFVLSYPANYAVGWLEVRNLAGQIVRRERIPQWSTVHVVELQGQAVGMYQCSLRWGAEVLTTRIILTER